MGTEFDKKEALNELKQLPILTKKQIYIVIPKVAPSGLSRLMRVFTPDLHGQNMFCITYQIGKLLDLTYVRDERAVRVPGCGMDMCYWLADALSKELGLSGENKIDYQLL